MARGQPRARATRRPAKRAALACPRIAGFRLPRRAAPFDTDSLAPQAPRRIVRITVWRYVFPMGGPYVLAAEAVGAAGDGGGRGQARPYSTARRVAALRELTPSLP